MTAEPVFVHRPMSDVEAVADPLGLTVLWDVSKDGSLTYVDVERPESLGGWSMARTRIAIAHDMGEASRQAITALRKMAPRLQKKLDELDPGHEGVALAAGVGSDGTVTTLRVERDGSVRLSHEDIAAIAEAVRALL